jgi:phospholipase/carboxylesterase
MNRIQPPPCPMPETQHPGSSASAVAAMVRRSAAGGEQALFAPMHYEPNYAYPLLVWLHSPGQSEAQLNKVMPQISMRNYVAVGPRGAAIARQQPTALAAGFDWLQGEAHVAAAEQRVLEAVETAQARFRIAADRIFLAGHDRGGTMAMRIALRHPGRFAGAVTLGGALPLGRAPLARLNLARRLQLLIICSRISSRYPTRAVCDDLRLLHSAGISVTLREYPGADDLTSAMLSDVDRWIMEQISTMANRGAKSLSVEG